MDSAYWEEETESRIGSREAAKNLLGLLKPHKLRLAGNLILLAIAHVAAIAGPVVIQQAIDVDISGKDYSGLIGTVVVYTLLQVVALGATFFQRLHLEILGQEIITDLKRSCFNHITRLSLAFFDRNPVGRLLSRVESDGESIRMLFGVIVVMLIGDLLFMAGMFAVMFYKCWQLTLILLAVAPFVMLLIYWFLRFTTPRFYEARKRMADIVAALTEYLQGMSVVQIFNRQTKVKQRVNQANQAKYKLDVAVHIAVVVFFNLVFFFETIGVGLVLYFGSRLIGVGAVTTGMLVMFILYLRRFFEPIHRASEQLNVIQRAIAGARRIFALLSNQEIIPEPTKPLAWQHFEKSIVFENVSFSYNNDHSYAVRDISFEVRKGEKVALVGVTGGGKSTIISLLLRFYDRTSGSITVDGIDIRNIKKVDLRAKFGLVLQDIFLFPGAIKENITLEQENVTDETLRHVAALVSADRFIERQPKGYDTEVSERGSNLSRGERQLLSFARAMIFNPQILLLDEATSSVDPDTEKRIQMALKRLLEGRTSIIIAHRLSTILDADRILVMRGGRIIERGTHAELLTMGGYYEKLFRLQFQEQEEAQVA